MRKAIVGFLAFWVVAMAAAAPTAAAEPIVFGLVDEVTGPQAEAGMLTAYGARLAQEQLHMTGNLSFRRIRQAKFLQPDPRTAPWSRLRLDTRKETFQYNLFYFLSSQGIGKCSSNYGTAPPCQRHRHTRTIHVSKQIFFCHTTEMRQRMPPLGVKTTTFGQSRFHHPRKGNIHIVTAEQEVIAYRKTFELELRFPFGHADETQVRCSTTDITH